MPDAPRGQSAAEGPSSSSRPVGRWARVICEAAFAAFLLTTPFGRAAPGAMREAMLLVMAVGLATSVVVDWRSASRPLALVLPAGAWVTVLLLSVVASRDVDASAAGTRFEPIALLVFFVVQHVHGSVAARRRLGLVVLAVVALLASDAIVQFGFEASFLGGQGLHGERARAGLPHPNDLGVIAVLLPIAVMALWRQRVAMRVVVALAVCAATAAVVVSQSRNSWLGLVVGATVVTALGGGRRVLPLVGAATIVLAAAVALDLAGIRDRLVSLTMPLQEGRIGLWIVAWNMFIDAPLLGHGPAMFGEMYLEYLASAELPRGYEPEVAQIPWAHNIYLELLCERGVLGLASFVWLVTAAGIRLRRDLRLPQCAGREDAIGVAGAGAAFLAMGVFDLTFLKDWVALVFWMLLGLCAAGIRRAGTSPSDEPGRARS